MVNTMILIISLQHLVQCLEGPCGDRAAQTSPASGSAKLHGDLNCGLLPGRVCLSLSGFFPSNEICAPNSLPFHNGTVRSLFLTAKLGLMNIAGLVCVVMDLS